MVEGSGTSFTTAPVTGKLGQIVDYEIIVRNTGNTSLKLSNFSDLKCDPGTIAGGPGSKALAPGKSTTYTCRHVLNSVGSYENEASVYSTPAAAGGECKPSNKVIIEVPGEPAFTIEKQRQIEGPFTTVQLSGRVGQTVRYQIIVKNTGNTGLTFSSFSDPHCDPGTISGGPGSSALAPGASSTYTCLNAMAPSSGTAKPRTGSR